MAELRYNSSAGLLPYRIAAGELEVFLAHMGGPLWAHKDAGAWSVAKGEYDAAQEHPRIAAAREFAEEIGMPAPAVNWIDLGIFHQRSGKIVTLYGVAAPTGLRFVESNLFELEWPRGSGRMQWFPEMDGAEWLSLPTAEAKILPGQRPMLAALAEQVPSRPRRTL
ncbi:MAG: NUDIX domain-containing protein [Candidatus Nanopelagicales bacterium]